MLNDDKRKEITNKLKEKGIIVASENMIQIYLEAEKIAKTNSSILITGESGVGKDYFAKYIHNESSKRLGPFIYINCSAIPSDLFVSEMFGYMPGTFTDAIIKRKIGILESADRGTIFLDEIGDLALENQVVLLNFLQNKRIKIIGAEAEKIVDVRVISATNKDLYSMMREGSFRKELFYQICVICIDIPPLRKRSTEIPELINSIKDKIYLNSGIKKHFTEDAIEFLSSCDWVGNIRELQNIITQIFYLEADDTITRNHIEGKYKISTMKEKNELNFIQSTTLKAAIFEFECQYIKKILRETNNIQEASIKLGISQATIYRKIKQFDIKI